MKNRKKLTVIVMAALLFVAVTFAAIVLVLPDSFSADTSEMLANTVSELDDRSEKELNSLFPVSENTGKLLSVNGIVLQNTNYLIDGSATAPPVIIGRREQHKIVDVITEEYPVDAAPWNTGYAGRCEQWVCDVYDKAELPTRDSCCASGSRDKTARTDGEIPVGAMIYSGPEYKSGFDIHRR